LTVQQTDHRSTASGGLFVAPDWVVDPRIGALGPALLALEDGLVLDGVAFGAPTTGGGDLVANTSYSGYQEICTDPSYAGQTVLMTYPLIGNYGRISFDDQSGRPWLRGRTRICLHQSQRRRLALSLCGNQSGKHQGFKFR